MIWKFDLTVWNVWKHWKTSGVGLLNNTIVSCQKDCWKIAKKR
jgi:hypothetical protein